MKMTLVEALKAADLARLCLDVAAYAEAVMVRKRWRGHGLGTGKKGQLLANGKSADDFAAEAFERLLNGRRSYREDMDLEANLKRTIDSIIDDWAKKTRRQPLLDRTGGTGADGVEYDPVEEAVDPASEDVSEVQLRERREQLGRLLGDFRREIEVDSELIELFEAYTEGITKPADVEVVTGIPAQRVSELKRKLRDRFRNFSGCHPFQEALEQ